MVDRVEGSVLVDTTSESEPAFLHDEAGKDHSCSSNEDEALKHRLARQSHALSRSIRSSHRRQYWVSEIESLLLAVIIAVVLIIVLNANDGKEIWTRPITLNALLSLLVTLFYMSVMFPVSSCILQLKWNHFSSPQRLYDFHLYDAATRSTRAALRIMASRAQSPLVFVAGFLVLAHTAIGPLTQQILLTSTIKLPISGSALIPVVRGLKSSQAYIGSDLQGAYALLAGVFADQTTNFNLTPFCSGANCEWQKYATIMVRSESSDLSDGLIYPDENDLSNALESMQWEAVAGADDGELAPSNISVVSTADGHALMQLSDMLNVLSAMNRTIQQPPGTPSSIPTIESSHQMLPLANQSPSNHNFSLLLANSEYNTNASGCPNATTVTVVYQEATAVYETSANDPSGKWSSLRFGKGGAWQATFDIALQVMQATMLDGVFNEEMTSGTYCFRDEELVNGNLHLTSQSQDFLIDPYSPLSLEWALGQLFQGQVYSYNTTDPKPSVVQHDYNSSFDLSSATSALFHFAMTQSNSSRGGGSGSSVPVNTMQDVFSNIAHSLSKTLRVTSGQTAEGTSVINTTVYKIDWPWVSIPLALLVSTALFLVAVIHDTRKKGLPVWTDSSMASMVHGIDGSIRRDLFAFEQTEELDAACKGLKVRLGGRHRVLEPSKKRPFEEEFS